MVEQTRISTEVNAGNKLRVARIVTRAGPPTKIYGIAAGLRSEVGRWRKIPVTAALAAVAAHVARALALISSAGFSPQDFVVFSKPPERYTENMTRLLFVCLGNICRSPTGESVMNALLRERGLADAFEVDSAGTGGWHVGNRADPRMRTHLEQRGYESTSRARQFSAPEDWTRFDLILAMDRQNVRDLAELDPGGEHRDKLKLMTDYCRSQKSDGVPDPYYGGAEGFERVIDLLEDACAGLLDELT